VSIAHTHSKNSLVPAPLARFFQSDRFLGNLLISPALMIVGIVMIIPLLFGTLLSFTDFQLGSAGIGHFTFLANYLRLLHDGEFLHSLGITVTFSVCVLFVELATGIIIAVLLMRIPLNIGKFFRVVITIPLLISPIIVGLAWRYMYDPLFGLVYQALKGLHAQNLFGGLSDVHWSLICIMVADIWETTPFILLVATSGIAAIPTDLYEAARIDGAGEIRLFFSITLPLLEKVIIVLSIIRGIDAFRIFDIIYALTGGGPANSTESLSIYIFKLGFSQYQLGYAMAISFITMIILLVIFLPLIKRSNENKVSIY
jgi:multiple sugar transport system permease protein